MDVLGWWIVVDYWSTHRIIVHTVCHIVVEVVSDVPSVSVDGVSVMFDLGDFLFQSLYLFAPSIDFGV